MKVLKLYNWIGRLLIQISLDTRPGFCIQTCYEGPGDTQFKYKQNAEHLLGEADPPSMPQIPSRDR